jgi:hypothetical protein
VCDLVFIKKLEIPRCGKICFLWVKRCLDSTNLLTKWLLDFGYLDLNLDFANMLTTMVIGFWIFEFEFGFSRYVNHNGYWILQIR